MKLFNKLKTVLVVSLLALASCTTNDVAKTSVANSTDIHNATVMVTNSAKTHGGTGVVLKSTPTQSLVLTNSHVCRVVENGGLVTGSAGSFQASAYKHSEKNDLCLIRVEGNLKANTRLAATPPTSYTDDVIVSGHPSLYPNVITKGHLSGRQNISVVIGVRKCTDEDALDPQNALMCMYLGGVPIVRSYDASLVSATIMPGSSGSAVYNSRGELIGLVFAGQGTLGYGWTMPYEAVYDFLRRESKDLKFKLTNNTSGSTVEKDNTLRVDEIIEKLHNVCLGSEKQKLQNLCDLENSNLVWYK